MTKNEVLQLLEDNKNQRGIDNWTKIHTSQMSSYGIGLTVLRKLAKKIGRDHELAMELWNSNNYDAKIISLLIDEPKALTREQAETQVDEIEGGHLAHVFSSCDATLGKTPFVKELAEEWIRSSDSKRRRCGYGLLYELSKSKKKDAFTDEYFIEHLKYIESTYANEDIPTLMAMATAVLGIGKRNTTLHSEALKLAKQIGPINFNEYEGQKCEPMNIEKNLNSDSVQHMK